MIRKIIHLDLDAFFCAVEEQREPKLRNRPFAVGGSPDTRGVVASCSYPARRFGIRSAMPMAQAVRRCPHLIIVPTNHRAYSAVSRQVMQRLRALTHRVEQISIDEAFLDVTDLADPAAAIARQLQQTINRELKLPCSLGVATNKLVAKIANNVGKAAGMQANGGARPPNAIQVVPPGREAEFLSPLPCRELWGVGPKTAETLESLGMQTIGDIAGWPIADLERRFGKHGAALGQRARGMDARPVEPDRETKSVSKETTFARDVVDAKRLKQTLRDLSHGVSSSLQHKSLLAATIKLKIRWPDFTTPTRQMTLDRPTDDGERIYQAALTLFERIWQPGQPVRLLGVGASGLSEQVRQLGLWDDVTSLEGDQAARDREARLHAAIDLLRNRFGDDAVQRASKLSSSHDG